MGPSQQSYVQSLQTHNSIFIWTVPILITLRKPLNFRWRHGFYASVVNQPQRSLSVVNYRVSGSLWAWTETHSTGGSTNDRRVNKPHNSSFVTLTMGWTLQCSIFLAYRTSRAPYKLLPILYISERMVMVFFRPLMLRSPNLKTFLSNYVGPSFRSLRKKPSRVNHAKAIAASSVPPSFLLAASPAPATVEHFFVATRIRIAMRSGLCMW